MKSRLVNFVTCIGFLTLVATLSAFSQVPDHGKLSGMFNDYTPAGSSGPWEVRGTWWMDVKGEVGKAKFSAELTMCRSDLGVMVNGGGDLNNPADRSAHTHHIMVSEATVTPIANGFRVAGPATITGNGNFPPPFGPNSTVQVDVVGGNSIPYSNIKLTFIGDAAGHFGSQPVNGVVNSADVRQR
jgi:hypothetical protein